MSESKRTPGPWLVKFATREVWSKPEINASPVHVATTIAGPHAFHPDEGTAIENAHFIASAPDLLLALHNAPELPAYFDSLTPAQVLSWAISYRMWYRDYRDPNILKAKGKTS
jgi:hypothetical protein